MLFATQTPELTIGYVQPGRDLRITPRLENTTYHINFAWQGRLHARSGDTDVEVQGTSASVHNVGAEHALHHWDPDTGVVGIKLSRTLVEHELEQLLGVPLEEPLVFESQFRLDTASGRSWLRLVRLLLTEFNDPAAFEDRRIREQYIRTLVVATLNAQPHNYLAQLRDGGHPSTPRTVRRVVAHIEQHFGGSLTVADLAAAGGTSVRRLQEVFQDQFGMSPMTYLRDVRLQHAHDLLREGRADVTEAARSSGLVHLGRFSAAYRTKFGELPSQTRSGIARRGR